MHYIKIRFTKGVEGLAYQEVDDSGNLLRYVSEKGETITLPEVTESEVVLSDSSEEDWMKAPSVIPEQSLEEAKEFIAP